MIDKKITICIKHIYAGFKGIKQNKAFFKKIVYIKKLFIMAKLSNKHFYFKNLGTNNPKIINTYARCLYEFNTLTNIERDPSIFALGQLLNNKQLSVSTINKIINYYNSLAFKPSYIIDRILMHPNTPTSFLLNYFNQTNQCRYILHNPNCPISLLLRIYKNLKNYKLKATSKKILLFKLHQKNLIGLIEQNVQ